MLIPLGITTGVYALLGGGVIVRGYGRWFLRMWRPSP